jgi:Leucine Rich repeat
MSARGELWRGAITKETFRRRTGCAILEYSFRLTDGGVEHIKGLIKLQNLDLDSVQITDAGLKQLAGLIELKVLDLGDTKVTDAGIAELQKVLPKTRMSR